MNILELQVNDVKRIRVVEINPATGEPIILTGDNAQGKSSILDSIVFALKNVGLDDPIRHGRPSGSISIKLGVDQVEYSVERRITKKGSYLTLRNAKGIEMGKAQTFLNGIIGNYAFDPLEFTTLKPKAQVEALKSAAKLDFTELDQSRAKFFEERTEIGRQGKELKARFEAMTEPSEGLPAEEVPAADLMKKLDDLRALEKAAADAADALGKAEKDQQEKVEEVNRLQSQLEAAMHAAKAADTAVASAQSAHAAATEKAPTPEAIAAARTAIEEVDTTNAAVRSAKIYRETKEKMDGLRLTYANLDRRIEEIDEQKASAVKNADLPLDGLELTDDGILFNGTFFNQLSTAEQIRISTLVAMSQNPSLKIILIREGALMNRANLSMVADLAKERGFQVWIEKFQEDPGDKGLHIVDGAVAYVDGEAVSAPAA